MWTLVFYSEVFGKKSIKKITNRKMKFLKGFPYSCIFEIDIDIRPRKRDVCMKYENINFIYFNSMWMLHIRSRMW